MGSKGESSFISPNPICKNLVHCPHQRTPGNQCKIGVNWCKLSINRDLFDLCGTYFNLLHVCTQLQASILIKLLAAHA